MIQSKDEYLVNLSEMLSVSSEDAVSEKYVKKFSVQVKPQGEACTFSVYMKLEETSFYEKYAFSTGRACAVTFSCTEKVQHLLAYEMFNRWWTAPRFLETSKEIPGNTTLILLDCGDQYTCAVACPGDRYQIRIEGGDFENELRLVLLDGPSDSGYAEEDLMVCADATDPYLAVSVAMQAAAKKFGIPLRAGRVKPTFAEKLGWCSWNAFYKKVSKKGLLEKCKELQIKQLVPGWVLIDDGWQQTKENEMASDEADPVMFPDGLEWTVRQIMKTGVEKVGVWNTFNGYWDGISTDYLARIPAPGNFCRSENGHLQPNPKRASGEGFYDTYFGNLKMRGVSFSKMDSQSSAAFIYRGQGSYRETVASLHRQIDHAAQVSFGGGLINCMGMDPLSIFSRPVSTLSRNSDDYVPDEEHGFYNHLKQNAYNALYHSILYECDWDMFLTYAPDAEKQALIRAMSGGPVYISDQLGKTDADILRKVTFRDGTAARTEGPGIPSERCLFEDPEKEGFLEIISHLKNEVYYAIFSYKKEKQEIRLPLESILKGKEEDWICYEYSSKIVKRVKPADMLSFSLEGESFYLLVFIPVRNGRALIGEASKFVAGSAILDVHDQEDETECQLREARHFLFYSERRPAGVWLGEHLVPCEKVSVVKQNPLLPDGVIEEEGRTWTFSSEETGKWFRILYD